VLTRSAVLVCGLVLLTGCGPAINQAAVEDAESVMRVKTALVNDPVIGVYPIEVRVVRGVATLIGGVAADADVARAVGVAAGVAGISDVRSELQVGIDLPSSSLLPPQPRTTFLGEEPDYGSLLAAGVAVRRVIPGSDSLASSLYVDPQIRLGSGTGLGVSIGFNWTDSDLSTRDRVQPLGCLKIRPIMAGVSYTLRSGRVSTSVSAIGGPSFNGLCRTDEVAGPTYALAVRTSLAWRLGASTWVELGDRWAANLFTGYLTTRPRISVIEDGRVESYQQRVDAPIVSAGLVYKFF